MEYDDDTANILVELPRGAAMGRKNDGNKVKSTKPPAQSLGNGPAECSVCNDWSLVW